jgi:spore coat polysaccharide biosynthesis protein SpsF
MPGVGIILQARTGSSRLPGKVLRLLAGKPMIQWIIERLQLCRKSDVLILATSTLAQDLPLAELCDRLGVNVFRGSETDVLDRYYQCAKKFGLAHIVRATGDNPFVDPEECDRLIEFYFADKLDYATISTEPEDGYPIGVGVEVFSFPALERSWEEGTAPHHREHVNEYILENPGLFRQATMEAPAAKRGASLSLTVDTIEEFANAKRLYEIYLTLDPSQPPPVDWVISHLKE